MEPAPPPRPAPLATSTTAGRRAAYFNTRYPALSHTFIQREIEALESLGLEVTRISLRRPSLQELGAGADDAEIKRTTFLLRSAFKTGLAVIAAALRNPIGLVRALIGAQRISPGGIRERARHVAYAVEALLLRHALRARRLGAVHVHMGNNGAMVALLCRSIDPSITYSLTIHGPSEFVDMGGLRIREKAEHASFVRFISDAGRAQVMAITSPAVWNRFHVIHCGVDTKTFTWAPKQRGADFRILGVGRLAPVKGFRFLVEAVASLISSGVPCRLTIVGDGPDRPPLEALANSLGIADRVHFSGPLAPTGVRKELERADALASSSFMEGIPVVLMEAMSVGVPVVATRVGGVPELVDHRVTGLVVPPGSSGALAAALEEVWRDPVEACSRARTARARVEDAFEARRTAQQMCDLLTRSSALGDSNE